MAVDGPTGTSCLCPSWTGMLSISVVLIAGSTETLMLAVWRFCDISANRTDLVSVRPGLHVSYLGGYWPHSSSSSGEVSCMATSLRHCSYYLLLRHIPCRCFRPTDSGGLHLCHGLKATHPEDSHIAFRVDIQIECSITKSCTTIRAQKRGHIVRKSERTAQACEIPP